MTKILVIGAGGDVGSVFIERILPAADDATFTLADIDAARIPARFRSSRAVFKSIDLYNSAGVSSEIKEHDLVVNCAGPFINTAAPVARLCVEHGRDYLDLCDDIEAFDDLLALDEKAKNTGSRLLVGAGVSPGFTNVFAADLKTRFDTVKVLDVAWLSGDEGGNASGEAVLDHVLHIAGGEGIRWRNGSAEKFESYTIPSIFQLGGVLGNRTLYEIAHPEPMMLGRTFPDVSLIRCFGGIDPTAIGALVRGVARAVSKKQLDRSEAIDFMKAASVGKIQSSAAWLPAIRGIADGLFSGMIGVRDVKAFASYLFGKHQEFAGGIACRASGSINGKDCSLILRSIKSGPGTFIDSMPNATGTCAAAFSLILKKRAIKPGVRFPEELSPEDVYHSLGILGFDTRDIIDDVIDIST